jgi:hypothetical protein
MSHTVPTQHPAVVLRSSYQHLQALLAIGTIVIVGLTVAVVALAINTSSSTTQSHANHATSAVIQAGRSIAVQPNPDELVASPAAAPTSSEVQESSSTAIQPNPDELAARSAAAPTSSAVQESSSTAIQPNPDERGF